MHKKVAVIFCIAAMFCSGVVSAAPHWQLWGDKNEGKLYYDLNTLKKTGNIIHVTEKEDNLQPDTKGIKGNIYQRQYDVKKSQWRTVSRQVYNAQGKFLGGNKKIEPWTKVHKESALGTQMEYLLAASRLQGPWVQVKPIGDLAVKYYNPDTLHNPKKNIIEVWEKLTMNKVAEKTKEVVTFVRYDLAKGTATTLYTCNFNAQGELLEANSEIDHWSAEADTYGEYIGRELSAKINSQKVHKY